MTFSIICAFVFGGFCLTLFCLWYLTYYDPLTPEEQEKMRQRNKKRETKRITAIFGEKRKWEEESKKKIEKIE